MPNPRSRPRMLGQQSSSSRPRTTQLIEKHAVLITAESTTTDIDLDNPTQDGYYVAVLLQGIGFEGESVVGGLGAAWQKTSNNASYYSENSDAGRLWECITPAGGTAVTVTTAAAGTAHGVAVFVYVFYRRSNAPLGLPPVTPWITQGGSFNGPNDTPPIVADAPRRMCFSTAVSESAEQDLTSEAPANRWDAPLKVSGLPPGYGGVTESWASTTWRETGGDGETNGTDWTGGVRCASTLYMMSAPLSS